MAVTYNLLETFTGTRDGNIVDDISVKFTSDDPVWSLTRNVICIIEDGVYNEEETKKSIERIAKNFEYYLAQGVTKFNHY